MKFLVQCLFYFFCCSCVQAADLVAVFEEALKSDPTFKAAQATRLSAFEAYPQARSALLPQIILDGSYTRDRQNNKALNLQSNAGVFHPTTWQYNLSLTQAIFNYSSWSQLKEAADFVKQAEAAYDAAYQDLIIRVSEAYFLILQNEATLRFTQAEKEANARQLDQARQRFKVGLDAITSVYDAKARYDAVIADEIAAKNNLENSREALREITGVFYTKISGLKVKLPLIKPQPENVEEWVKSSQKYNYQLLASKYAAKVAKQTIKTNFAGNYPVINGTVTRNELDQLDRGNPDFNRTRNSLTSYGIQFNFPIYQGGLVRSQTQQAIYDYDRAAAEMERVYRQSIRTTRESYNNVVSGISRIKADRQAVKSNQSSLESSEAAFKVGTRTIVDVLIAQRDLFRIQRQTSQDEYSYIVETLRLKQAAGTLCATDLDHINQLLT